MLRRSDNPQVNIPVESARNYEVRTLKLFQRPLSHTGINNIIHSKQGSGLLYTAKDHRTLLTPAETLEPLKDFLNTFLPRCWHMSIILLPCSTSREQLELAKSSLSCLFRWHIIHSLNHCYPQIYEAVMGDGVCVAVCHQDEERKMREAGEKAFWQTLKTMTENTSSYFVSVSLRFSVNI